MPQVGPRLAGQDRGDAPADVADVGRPFAEVVVVDGGERRRPARRSPAGSRPRRAAPVGDQRRAPARRCPGRARTAPGPRRSRPTSSPARAAVWPASDSSSVARPSERRAQTLAARAATPWSAAVARSAAAAVAAPAIGRDDQQHAADPDARASRRRPVEAWCASCADRSPARPSGRLRRRRVGERAQEQRRRRRARVLVADRCARRDTTHGPWSRAAGSSR